MNSRADEIKQRISELASHFTFRYNDKNCGVDPLSQDCFEIWCGEYEYTAHSIEDVMNQPIFEEKTLAEIALEIEIIDW